MPNQPYDPHEAEGSAEEYRRRRHTRAQKRQKRRTQRIVLFGALVLIGALVIFSLVMILRAVFGPKDPAPPKGGSGSSTSQASGAGTSGAGTSGGASSAGGTSAPAVNWPTPADPNVWNLALVNGQKPLAENHEIPLDQLGQVVHGGVAYYFDSRIVSELKAMLDACNAATGGSLRVVSGYRGPSTQNKNYNYLLTLYKGQGLSDADADAKARKLDPPSGYSEHQAGLAADFAVGSNVTADDSFAQTAEYAWLLENAAEYGFILRYTSEKEAITGMAAQPYHWRYVGKDDAVTIKNAGICLEEYLAAVSGVQTQPPPGDADSGSAGSAASDA